MKITNKIMKNGKILSIINILLIVSYINCDILGVPEDRIFSIDKNQESYQFNVKSNDEFLIEVRGNPTTGYSWYLKENSDKEDFQGLNLNKYNSSKDYVHDSHPPGFVGGGGIYYFKFKGTKVGTFKILLEYKRHWEPKAIKNKPITIIITE